ncbi:MAG TPA: universal stress protein [Vicinamibacterales bacterium]|nr:universal stress protein [Vicinamibacterales bacterium]
MARITRILVPTDFSETSDLALQYAKSLAEALGASLHVLHVFEDPYVIGTFSPEVYGYVPEGWRETALQAAQDNLLKRFPESEQRRFSGSAQVVTGNAVKTILGYAEQEHIDLIVMGTHGRSGVAHLLIGSVAEKVVRAASCPVLTIRHPEAHEERAGRQTAAVTAD